MYKTVLKQGAKLENPQDDTKVKMHLITFVINYRKFDFRQLPTKLLPVEHQ